MCLFLFVFFLMFVLFFTKLSEQVLCPTPSLYISITLFSSSSSFSSSATLRLLKGCDQSILLYIGSVSDKRSFSVDFNLTVIFSIRLLFLFFFNSFFFSSYCLDIVLFFFIFQTSSLLEFLSSS